MPRISSPVAASERMAVSRPDPGPLTNTSTLTSPCSWARRAAASAASCAANGVDFREPLKPTLPALAHESVFPSRSVMVTMVLLNVDLMCAWPCETFFFSRRRVFFCLGLATSGQLPLLALLAAHTDRLLRALAGPGVRVRPLSAHREAPAVPDALVRADLDLALDVLRHVAAEVTFDLVFLVDPLADADDLFLGQVAHLPPAVQAGAGDRRLRARLANTVDVLDGDVHALVAWQVDAGDACHERPPIPAAAC